jgi:hypothetical protein
MAVHIVCVKYPIHGVCQSIAEHDCTYGRLPHLCTHLGVNDGWSVLCIRAVYHLCMYACSVSWKSNASECMYVCMCVCMYVCMQCIMKEQRIRMPRPVSALCSTPSDSVLALGFKEVRGGRKGDGQDKTWVCLPGVEDVHCVSLRVCVCACGRGLDRARA